jgi:hypothetical protein
MARLGRAKGALRDVLGLARNDLARLRSQILRLESVARD